MDMEVSKELNSERDQFSKIQKLLFLGSGGSGKSTFFKQLKCIHGKGFNEKDRRVFKEHISAQIIDQIQRAVECIPSYNERLPQGYEHIALSEAGQESANFILEIGVENLVNDEIARHIETLWKEDAIQQIYQNRALYHIDDSSAYFFEDIMRVADIEFMPTDQDIVYVRYRTTGVIESKFNISGSNFHIFDVGGQQSERKKWIHCFEHVTAVIFVASLSCYDELMFEDDTTNCMHDSLELFKEICNLQWFVTTPIILFLNKKDLFEKKIHIIPLSTCFAEYTRKPVASHHMDCDSPSNPDAEPEAEDGHTTDEHANLVNEKEMRDDYETDARNYIKQKFVANNSWPQRPIYTHITCATDKDNVLNVFNDVQQIVVANGLQRNNLI